MDSDVAVRPGESKEAYRERRYAAIRARERTRRRELISGAVPVVMDVDDFGFLMPGYDDLLRLKATYPAFRVTAFTIPFPKEFFAPENRKLFKVEQYRKWAAIVNEQDWIEVAVHGFAHTHFEMEAGYDKCIELIKAFENLFEEIGLTYSKIFKAPFWQYSYDAFAALRDRGYTVALDRNHPRPVPKGLPTYLYNWSFEEAPPAGAIIKGHGHFTGRNLNNIRDTLPNIAHHLPAATRFMTIGEYLASEWPERESQALPIIL